MTQEEIKARELVEQFWKSILGEPEHTSFEPDDIDVPVAKQCALICNQQEIDQLNRMADYWDLKNGEWYKDEFEKLNAVKQAIINLK